MDNGISFRLTSQRRVILDEIRNTSVHPTAAEVYERVRRRIPTISLGTVYRNLELLCEQGLIRCIRGGDQRRYDADLTNHYHVRCTVCGRVDDLPASADGAPERFIADDFGYEILSCVVRYLGICPDCRKRRGAHAALRTS
jgi:Fur family ferric uptake transcriptional regulator